MVPNESKPNDKNKERKDSILKIGPEMDNNKLMLQCTETLMEYLLEYCSKIGGNISIVDALLDYGADPFVANKSRVETRGFWGQVLQNYKYERR